MFGIINYAKKPRHLDINFIARGSSPSSKDQLASAGKERKRLLTSGQSVRARVVHVGYQITRECEQGEQHAVLVPSQNAE
jgi:DNA-directed RNA polymerase subunit E'/Rpb7